MYETWFTLVKIEYTQVLRIKTKQSCKNRICILIILQNVKEVIDFNFTF